MLSLCHFIRFIRNLIGIASLHLLRSSINYSENDIYFVHLELPRMMSSWKYTWTIIHHSAATAPVVMFLHPSLLCCRRCKRAQRSWKKLSKVTQLNNGGAKSRAGFLTANPVSFIMSHCPNPCLFKWWKAALKILK